MRLLRLLTLLFAPAVLAQSADLSVTVTLPPTAVYDAVSPFSVATATGQLTVTNAGPSTAQNVSIDFDANLANVFVPGFQCGTTSGHYRCTAATMAPASFTVSFSEAWLLPRDGTSKGTVETATVTVSSSSPADPNLANNSASANTTVVWQADVELETNGIGFPPAAPGDYYSIYAFFSNNGPSPASDVKVTLTVPPGAAYVSYVTQGLAPCTEPPKGGQGDLVCTGSNLAVGGGYEAAMLVRIDPSTLPGTVITFPITLTSTTATKPTQATSTPVTIIEPANLQVQMSAPASAHPGDTFLTTVTLTNYGPGAAYKPEVFVKTALGISTGPMNAPAGWLCIGTICDADSLAPGTATFTFPTTIPWNAGAGTLTNQFVAQAANIPDTDHDNVATASTDVIPWPPSSLKLTLTASPEVVYTGDQLTYTATIANTGNADAKNVQLTWSVPGTVTATTCGTTGDAICTFATIPAGTTQTATRTVHVAATAGLSLTAQATVKAANVTYDAPSASATVTTPVAGTPHVNLRAVITPPNGPRAGMTWPWSYRVYNDGPDTATDWQLSFPIPANTTVVDAAFAAGTGTCTGLTPNAAANTQVTCHGTVLLPAHDVELVVNLAITPGTTAPIHATETVSTSNNDLYPQDNTATTDTAVTSSELVASLTEDKTTAVFGERVTQTLTVTNNGPDASSDITVQFSLPPGAVNPIINSTSLSCVAGTQPIQCTAAPLQNGAALTAAISFQVPASAVSLRTQADVFWVSRGFNTFTTATIVLQVVPPPPTADLSVTLDATPTTLNTGDTVTYTIAATNLGGAPASNVTVELDLPPSLVFVSASPQCSGGPLVTCSAGTLNGGSTPAMFTVTARAVEAGTVKTIATVSTTSEESSNGNNSAAAAIVVNAAAPQPARRRAVHH